MTLQVEPVGSRLLINPGIDLGVAELLEASTGAADQVVMVRPLGELVADAAIFQWHTAEQFQVLEELDRAEHRCPANTRHVAQEVFDREGARRPFDGAKDGPARRGRTEADGFKPRRRRFRECHRSMVPNGLIRAPENGRRADDQVFLGCRVVPCQLSRSSVFLAS